MQRSESPESQLPPPLRPLPPPLRPPLLSPLLLPPPLLPPPGRDSLASGSSAPGSPGRDSPAPGLSAPGSPACPDLLCDVSSLQSLPYQSFFEEECRIIVSLILGTAAAAASAPGPADGSPLCLDTAAAAAPSPGPWGDSPLCLGTSTAAPPSLAPWDDSSLWLDPARLATSTPLHASQLLHERAPDSARPAARPNTGAGEAAAPGPARGDPQALLLPAADSCPGPVQPRSHLPRTSSCKAARRSTAQPPCGGRVPAGRPRTPARSSGRGGGRLTVSRAQAPLALQFPKVGRRLSALGTRIPRSRGTKLTLAAKSSLQHPSRASQLVQPSAAPKPAPQDTEMKTAGKVVGFRQPSQTSSTRIPILASHSRPLSRGKVPSPKRFCSESRLIPGKGQEMAACAQAQRKESEMQTRNGSTTQELIHNTTRELTENNESKEQLVAAGTLLGAGEQYGGRIDQTWESAALSCFSGLVPGLTPGCGDAVAAEQSAIDQLSQELKHVKSELERLKAVKCEACCQTISSLQAQLRAAGICPEGAAVEKSGDSGRD